MSIGPDAAPDPPSAVRPFLLTSGRVAVESTFPAETQVVATSEGLGALGSLAFEHRAIIETCRVPLSLAEVAAKLRLHLNVVRVLAGDLRNNRHLTVHAPQADMSSNVDVLRRVIDGLRAIPTSTGSGIVPASEKD